MTEQFALGDLVRNVNPASRYYGKVGAFQGLLPWVFQSPGCDVAYPGEAGPYGHKFIAQRVADLERVVDATD